MARFDTSGMDEMLAEMKRLGELEGETADRMLMAGAKESKAAWKKAAQKHHHRDTGDMIESIGYAGKPRTADGVRMIDIYPQGKDKKGVRNAEKAFVLHYGRSNMQGSHFVDDADAEAAETVPRAMGEIWDQHLEGK